MGGGISKRSKNQDAGKEGKENDPNLAPDASAITDENGGALSARSPSRGVLKGGSFKGVGPTSTEDDPSIQPSHRPANVARDSSPMASVKPNRKQRGKLALKTAKPLAKDYRPEVLHMAEALGIDPFEEQDVMWIAEKAVDAPIKPPWGKYMDKSDGTLFYFNAETKSSQWRHPMEQQWRDLVREERQKHVIVEENKEGREGEESSVVYQREPTFVKDASRYAVLIPSMRVMCTQYNYGNPAPVEWGLIKITRQARGGPAEKARTWYHARARGCQIPYVSAIFTMYDKLPEHDPRSTESEGMGGASELLHYNGETIVSMDLSLNNIMSLKSGSLGAFLHLRSLNLSANCLTNTEGVGAAPGLKELDLSNNKIKTPADLRGDTALVTSSPGLIALKGLTTLNLDHNLLFNIKPLLRLTKLTNLSLMSNSFKNLWGIDSLYNLEVLNVRNNQLEELTGELESDIPGEEKKERIKLQESLTNLDVGNNKIPTIELILESLHPDCDLITLNMRGNVLREDISNRYTLLDRFENLAMLDGQEVKPAMRYQLAEMHRLEQVKGIAQAVKDSFTERLVRERKRKDWGLETLRSQERNLEELFLQMQAKMEAEVLRSTNQMLITGKEKMSIAMVVRAKKMAADLREKHEKEALAFAEKIPKGSVAVETASMAQVNSAVVQAQELGRKDREEVRRNALKVKVKAVMAAQRLANEAMSKRLKEGAASDAADGADEE